MNTTDSAAILEAIHQACLAKRGVCPQPVRPSRVLGGRMGWRQLPGPLLLRRSQHFVKCQFGSILRGEFCSEGTSSPEMCVPKDDALQVTCHICSLFHSLMGGFSQSRVCLSFSFSPTWILLHPELAQTIYFSIERGRFRSQCKMHTCLILWTFCLPPSYSPRRTGTWDVNRNSQVCQWMGDLYEWNLFMSFFNNVIHLSVKVVTLM